MLKSDFQNIGKITIAGKTKTLYEHRHLAWYRFGKCQIQAKTREEAVAKFRECAEQTANRERA